MYVHAQRKHFMYVQSENKEPFYVLVNNKNYSSSLSGYLVIPRLKNGKYFFVAGFPKDKYPEQKFSYVINDKDVGFVLKQFGNEGWGLFNIIDFTKIMANADDWEKDKMQNDTITLDDTYSINPVIKTTEKPATTHKKTTQQTETTTAKTEVVETTKTITQNTDTVTAEQETTTPDNSKSTTATNTTQKENKTTQTTSSSTNKKGIIRTYQKAGINGVDETYVDYTTSPSDTIIVFIPIQKEQTTTSQKGTTTEEPPIVHTNYTKNEQYNTACVNLATEADVLRVRKLMSAETSDDKMIQVAKKTFGTKCYYVEQIQKLGLLFLSEQSRLKFFSAAYPTIYDKFNYPSLEMQFTLSSVINQFRQSL